MRNKLRWGILGAGKIAHSFSKDIKGIENAELVAVASSNAERAKAFAVEYNIPLVYNYSELYKSIDVDAVYIATTHNFHFEQAMDCLKQGKHVLCEKPITVNTAQFLALSALAKEKNLFLMEAMWTWFLPAIQKAKEWLEAGKIGDLRVVSAEFGVPMEKKMEGRMYNINLAGGSLLDLGVYPVGFTTLFTSNKPHKITASGVLTPTGVDERTGILLEYGEISATVFCSMVNIMSNRGLLSGYNGYIVVPNFYKASEALLFDNYHNLLEKFEDTRTTLGYNFEIEHATNCILAGKLESEVITHAKSLQLQEIMTNARQQIGLKYPGE